MDGFSVCCDVEDYGVVVRDTWSLIVLESFRNFFIPAHTCCSREDTYGRQMVVAG